MAISIHSLVKRETLHVELSNGLIVEHFNPLPRKEGDYGWMLPATRNTDFNPLPRKEGDIPEGWSMDKWMIISIHSLVKRETSGGNPTPRPPSNFNPLPRKEGDSAAVWLGCLVRLDFNPLPRKEGDSRRTVERRVGEQISIHSLVKRETVRKSFSFISTTQFQSTPS